MSLMISTKALQCDAKTAEEAKLQVVIANRIFANEGALDALGHVSYRNPENPNTFFQARSVSPEFVTLDDILEIDMDGNVLNDPRRPYGERILHARILANRPDVNCVFHGHPADVLPFCCCPDVPLLPVMNYGSMYYEGCGWYDSSDVSSGMIVVTAEEGERVNRAMEGKYAVLMRGHGISTAAPNMFQLVIDTMLLIKNAKIQQQCLAMGGTPKCCIEEEGRAYRKITHGENALVRQWNFYVNRAKKAMPDIADINI